jgi:hypothetical protein
LPKAEALPKIEALLKLEALPKAEALPKIEALLKLKALPKTKALPKIEALPRKVTVSVETKHSKVIMYCNSVQDEMEKGAQDGEHERHAYAPDAPRPCLRSPSPPPGISD